MSSSNLGVCPNLASAHSVANPERTWAKGDNPKILTDEDVNQWLSVHAPEVFRSIKSEEVRITKQKWVETIGVREEVSDNGNMGFREDGLIVQASTEAHWANALFPGLGREEICQSVKPLLDERLYLAFLYTFRDRQSNSETAKIMSVNRVTIAEYLQRARKTIYEAFRSNRVSLSEDDIDPISEFSKLISQEDSIHPYHAPSAYAEFLPSITVYSCLKCSKHLTFENLDHIKVGKGRPRYLKCNVCGEKYEENRWAELAV